MDERDLQAVATHELLTQEQEWALASRIQKGDKEALKELIEKNIRLVVHLAKRYTNRNLSLEEYISVGAEALYEAAIRFDPKRKLRFSTMATYWIKRYFADLYWDSRSSIMR